MNVSLRPEVQKPRRLCYVSTVTHAQFDND